MGDDEVVSARDFHVKMPTGPHTCPIRYFAISSIKKTFLLQIRGSPHVSTQKYRD